MFMTEAQPAQVPSARSWKVALGARVELGPKLGSLGFVAQRGGLAAERLPPVLEVRRRTGGETLRPARSAKTQTLQHLCQSHGVLPWLRDALPLVFAGDVLIAVADLWTDGHWCAAADAPGLGIAWNDGPPVT
jgi:tRNA(Ile)-lysidine synthetase-like protein